MKREHIFVTGIVEHLADDGTWTIKGADWAGSYDQTIVQDPDGSWTFTTADEAGERLDRVLQRVRGIVQIHEATGVLAPVEVTEVVQLLKLFALNGTIRV